MFLHFLILAIFSSPEPLGSVVSLQSRPLSSVCCVCLYVCLYLFVLGFYGPVNNKVMSSRSVNSGTVPRQA